MGYRGYSITYLVYCSMVEAETGDSRIPTLSLLMKRMSAAVLKKK